MDAWNNVKSWKSYGVYERDEDAEELSQLKAYLKDCETE